MSVVVDVYRITGRFPSDERFGLVSQMRRAAVSVPSNLAEGHQRNGRAEYARFVGYALGSCAELATQLEIAERLNYIETTDANALQERLTIISKMLNRLASSLDGPPQSR